MSNQSYLTAFYLSVLVITSTVISFSSPIYNRAVLITSQRENLEFPKAKVSLLSLSLSLSLSLMEMRPGPMPKGSMNSNNTMMNMIMQMSFYWGKDATILFHGWPDNKLGMYVLAFFFVFLLAFAIEVLSILPDVKRTSTNPMLGALTQTIIYTFRMGFAYLVMLSVMSFNLGIFIAALAGHFVGFFLVKSRALAVPKPTETTFCTAVIPKV